MKNYQETVRKIYTYARMCVADICTRTFGTDFVLLIY